MRANIETHNKLGNERANLDTRPQIHQGHNGFQTQRKNVQRARIKGKKETTMETQQQVQKDLEKTEFGNITTHL